MDGKTSATGTLPRNSVNICRLNRSPSFFDSAADPVPLNPMAPFRGLGMREAAQNVRSSTLSVYQFHLFGNFSVESLVNRLKPLVSTTTRVCLAAGCHLTA